MRRLGIPSFRIFGDVSFLVDTGSDYSLSGLKFNKQDYGTDAGPGMFAFVTVVTIFVMYFSMLT